MTSKLSVFVAVVVALNLAGVAYLVHKGNNTFQKPDSPTAASFKEDESKYATDLIGKTVTLPQGQLWGFNWEQQISVTQANKKVVDENTVVVVVDIKAIAKVTPMNHHELDKGKEAAQVVTLGGYAKLIYERVNGQWYLSVLEGVSLKVTAEKTP